MNPDRMVTSTKIGRPAEDLCFFESYDDFNNPNEATQPTRSMPPVCGYNQDSNHYCNEMQGNDMY
jgi:hypothetical protein